MVPRSHKTILIGLYENMSRYTVCNLKVIGSHLWILTPALWANEGDNSIGLSEDQ